MTFTKKDAEKLIEKIIPDDVLWIIDRLEKNGYEAFAVGGCVRDAILGCTPKDWDITTSAKPMEVKKIFRNTIDTGLKHGTVTVRKSGESYEVTTYRIDGTYSDGRHPDNVEFTSDLKEDLRRRDFTINAMAYNPSVGIVDEFGGVHDLERGIIRCVGVASERFSEDALRILRAVRFAGRLGFEIDYETLKAMGDISANLVNISKERIYGEIDKLLMSPHPEKIKILYDTGVSKVVMPWFDKMMETKQNTPYHKYSVGMHTIEVVKNIRDDHYLRWIALLHDVAKPMCKTTDENGRDHFKKHAYVGSDEARKILRGLKADNKTIEIVTKTIKCHDDLNSGFERDDKNVRKLASRIGREIFPYFLELYEADIKGKSDYGREESLKLLLYISLKYQELLEKNVPLEIKDLKITGNDLIDMGMKPGREIGETLKYLLEIVIDNPEINEIERLKEIVRDNRLE